MIIRCSWCKADIESNDIVPLDAVSHGICGKCYAQHEAWLHDEKMDAIADRALLADED